MIVLQAERYSLNSKKGDNAKTQTKLLEVKLYVPGGTMFVREQGTTFEEATDLAIDTLKMKVKKFKDKRSNARISKVADDTATESITVLTEETED